MGEAVAIVLKGSYHLYAVVLGTLCCVLQVVIPYKRYVKILKWLTLFIFTYVAIVFSIDIPWRQVAHGIVSPHITLNANYITTVVAIFGTTISPYLFFWQGSQEVEEARARNKGCFYQDYGSV